MSAHHSGELSSWEASIQAAIAERNATQSNPFRQIIESHKKLRAEVAVSSVATSRLRVVENEKTALEALVNELQQASKGVTLRSGREVDLERKVNDLQTQLNSALVQQSDYYRIRFEKKNQDQLVTELQQKLIETEATLKRHVIQSAEREQDHQTVIAEYNATRVQNEFQLKKLITLQEENQRFLSDLLSSKDREAQLQDTVRKLEEDLLNMRKGTAYVPEDAPLAVASEARFSVSMASFGSANGTSVPSSVARCVEDAHHAECYCIAVTDNGRQIWTGGNDKLLRSWDAALNSTGQLSISSAPLCMDSVADRLVVGSPDGICRVWDLTTSRSVAQLTGHSDKILAAYFALSPAHVVSCSTDRTIRLWDVNHSSTTGTILCPSACFDISACDDRICSGHFDGAIRLWDPRSRSVVMEVKQVHDGKGVISLRMTPDRNSIVSMGRDNSIRITDCRTSQLIGSPMTSEKLSLSSTMMRLSLSPDGLYCACGSASGSLFIWSLAGNKTQPIKVLDGQHKSLLSIAVWLPDGKGMVSIGQDRRVNLWK